MRAKLRKLCVPPERHRALLAHRPPSGSLPGITALALAGYALPTARDAYGIVTTGGMCRQSVKPSDETQHICHQNVVGGGEGPRQPLAFCQDQFQLLKERVYVLP